MSGETEGAAPSGFQAAFDNQREPKGITVSLRIPSDMSDATPEQLAALSAALVTDKSASLERYSGGLGSLITKAFQVYSFHGQPLGLAAVAGDAIIAVVPSCTGAIGGGVHT